MIRIYIEDFDIFELYFGIPGKETLGGIESQNVSLIYDPVTKEVAQGSINGADWLYSHLSPIEVKAAASVVGSVLGTIMSLHRKELP